MEKEIQMKDSTGEELHLNQMITINGSGGIYAGEGNAIIFPEQSEIIEETDEYVITKEYKQQPSVKIKETDEVVGLNSRFPKE